MKHYAVHSGPEKKRHPFDAVVDDKDLYDSYLYAFRYCTALSLPDAQKELALAVLAEGKPTVLVNVSGSTVNPEEAGEKANAFLQCFYPSAEGGTALANILFGKTSPSDACPLPATRAWTICLPSRTTP